MSRISSQPVTWQDYADLWSSDPSYKSKYDIIKPTLDALGITPQGAKNGSDTPSQNTNSVPNAPSQKQSVNTGHPNQIGADTPQSSSSSGQDNSVGPGFPPQGAPYKESIEKASRITGVPASLLAGLIHDESRWNAGAGTVNANGLGDTGLVQMNDGTFAELQTKHPELQGKNKNDPETNILAGAFYLSDMKQAMKEKYGIDDWKIALRAYNSGPNGVDPQDLSHLAAGTGTANYVDKIMHYWDIVEHGGTLPA